jgi:hypothetical protein
VPTLRMASRVAWRQVDPPASVISPKTAA